MARGAQLTVVPSAPGRFQVLIGGKAQRLSYTGLPTRLGGAHGWIPPGFQPEVRGVWFDHFPDSGEGVVAMQARITGPKPGRSAAISIRAVDTTGPWKAMLTWQQK